MKTYSFLRETAPVIMKNAPKEGVVLKSGVFSLRALSLLTVTLPETSGKNDLSRTLQVTCAIIHADFKTSNESAARDALVKVC